MSKQPPPAPTASAVGPCPTLLQISRTPRNWKFTQHHRTTRPPPGGGLYFSKTRTFYKAKHRVVEQARKAMRLLYKRIRNFNQPIELQLQIFYQTILPILLHGSEVWGLNEIQIIGNLHCIFLCTTSKLKKGLLYIW